MQFRISSTIAVLSSIALLILSIGCQKSNVQASGTPKAMPVKVLVAQTSPVDETSEYVATIRSRSSTTISPQVDGQVTHIYVKSGDRVSAGALLMQIDPLKQQATVGSQEATRASKLANLRYAEQQFARVQKLYEAGVVSKQELDQSQSAYDAAKADLQALDAQVREQHVQLQYFKITAPTDGVVGDIPVHVGDRVTPTTVLTTVDQLKDLEAYIDVPIEKAPDLKIGRLVQIIDSDDNVIADSRISFISPHVNDQTQTILVKASINGSKTPLRTAQFARARIVWGSHQRVLIPVLSVSRINGQFFAFIAEESGGNSVARQRKLQLGELIGNNYVVLDGIKPGDKIITSSTQFLADGMPVAAQQAS
jgi:RND family efflux transporter MFP subunit